MNDLKKQLIDLENQPIWDVPGLRVLSPNVAEAQDLSRFLVSVKATTNLIQIGLSQAAEGIGQGWAAKKISYASMTVEWTVDQLKSGNYAILDLISSYFSDGFRFKVAQQIAGNIDPQIASTIVLMNTIVEFDRQETQYGQYLIELQRQVSRLRNDLERMEESIEAEHTRLRDIAEKGSTAFCSNEPPKANHDQAETKGPSYVDISALKVLENDVDPENLPLRITRIDKVDGGRAVLFDNNTPTPDDDYIRFAAKEGFVGKARITYTISDDLGLTSQGYIDVKVDADPTLQDDFEGELNALLNESIDRFNEQWDTAMDLRFSALEERLRDERQKYTNNRLSPFLGLLFQIAKIGGDYRDVAALECAESLYSGTKSDACEKVSQIVVNEELAKINKSRFEETASSTSVANEGRSNSTGIDYWVCGCLAYEPNMPISSMNCMKWNRPECDKGYTKSAPNRGRGVQ